MDRLDPALREKIKKCLIEPPRMIVGSPIGSGEFFLYLLNVKYRKILRILKS